MISISSRFGASPVSARALRTVPDTSARSNCLGETLTATLTSAGQSRQARHAFSRTSSPTCTMAPVSSAISMNSPAGIRPRSGWFQRNKASQVDDRLEMCVELIATDRIPEVDFSGTATACTRLHVLFEETDAPSPGAFRLVERHVGVPQQLIDILPVMRKTRDANAGPDDDLFSVDLVGLAHLLDQPQRQGLGRLPPVDTALEHDELVAAEP